MWLAAAACALLGSPVAAADADSSIPIALDTPVIGAIAVPGDSVSYSFDVAPGTRVFLDRLASSNTNGLSWRLQDAYGRELLSDTGALADLGPVALMGGSYVLTILGKGNATGTFEVIVHQAPAATSPITFDQTVGGDIDVPGGVQSYTFEAAAGDSLFVDLIASTSSSQLNWMIEGPTGAPLAARTTSLTDLGPIALLAGPHRLSVVGEGGATGSFEFRLVRTETTTEAVAVGDSIDGAIDQPGTTRRYTFSGVAGQVLYLDRVNATNASRLNWSLATAAGPAAGRDLLPMTGDLGDAGPFTLGDEDYVLTVTGEEDGTGTYSITLVEVIDSLLPVDLDTEVSGALDHPGQTARFTLTPASPTSLVLDVVSATNASQLNWWLEDAAGRRLVERTTALGDLEPVALSGGTYTVVVAGETDAVGTFTFVPRSLTQPAPVAVSLATPFSGSVDIPYAEASFAFSVVSGQIVTFDSLSASPLGQLNWQLHDSVGRVILDRTASLADTAPIALAGGDYVLTVLGENGATGTFEVEITDEGLGTWEPLGAPLTLEVEATGEVVDAATTTYLRLDLTADGRVLFDLTDGASNLDWELLDPAGRSVFSADAVSPTSADEGPFDLAAGDYTLAFSSTGSGPVTYGVTVLPVADTTEPAALDTTLSATPGPGSTHTYVFELTESTRVYADVIVGDDALRWSLLDAAGTPVFAGQRARRADTDDQGPYDLLPGTYRLVVDPLGSATPAYQLALREVVDAVAPCTIGELASAQLTSIGGTLTYTFDVTAPGLHYLDLVEGHSDLYWTLLDPQGQPVIDAARANNAASSDADQLYLGAGPHRLILDPRYDVLPAAQFQLVTPMVTTTPLTLGQQVKTQLAGPGDRLIYELPISNGPVRVYFDGTLAQTSLRWSAYDPSGRPLFEAERFTTAQSADQLPIVLADGTYRIEIWATGGDTPFAWFRVVEAPLTTKAQIVRDTLHDGAVPISGAVERYDLEVVAGQTQLVFDVTLDSPDARWTLTDPVGTPVWASAPADHWATADRGPIGLAPGSYKLDLFGASDSEPPYQFRVTGPPTVLELPEGCASCESLDVVFVFDTSISMVGADDTLCDLASDIIDELQDRGIDVDATFWGVTNTAFIPCVTDTVLNALGPGVPGDPPPELGQLDACAETGNKVLATESWAQGAAIVADRFPWREGGARLVIPVADEGPACGDPIGAWDIAAVEHAGAFAASRGVVVSPIFPSYVTDQHLVLGELLAAPGGGSATRFEEAPEELLHLVGAMAGNACESVAEDAIPMLTDTAPSSALLLPAGVPLVVSGRVTPVNGVRPVIAVEVDGRPTDSYDADGRWFATVTLPVGETRLRVSLVEACGRFETTLTLRATDAQADPFSVLTDVTPQLTARYSGTTLRHPADPDGWLSVQAAAVNAGGDLRGPVLLAIGPQLAPGIAPLNATGTTPEGEPYFLMVPEGQELLAGEAGPEVTLLFDNPSGRKARYEPRWLAPGNRAPVLTSAPGVTVRVGETYSYPAAAYDPDDLGGAGLSYALGLAPGTAQVDSQGLVTWSPAGPLGAKVVFGLTVSDGSGGSVTQQWTVEVVGSSFNRPPVFTSAPLVSSSVGATWEYAAHATDPDGDPVGYDLLEAPPGMTHDPVTGLVAWSHALPGSHTVTVEASDPSDGRASQTFTLSVGAPEPPAGGPTIVSEPPTTGVDDVLYSYQGAATHPADDALEWNLHVAPEGMTIDPSGGLIRWNDPVTGDHPIVIVVVDSAGLTATQGYTLSVVAEPPNQAPYFTTSPPLFAVVGVPYPYAPSALDPEGEAVTFLPGLGPAGFDVDPSSGVVLWTPADGDAGLLALSIDGLDPQGTVGTQSWFVVVSASNAAPVIEADPAPAALAPVGGLYRYQPMATDADGHELTWSLAAGPAGMDVDAWTGLVSWTPDVSDQDVHPVTLEVADCCGGVAAREWTVEAVVDGGPPEILLTANPAPACAGQGLTLCVDASDDVAVASVQLTVDDAAVPLVDGCAVVEAGSVGSLDLEATATDASDQSSSTQWTLDVVDCTDEERPEVVLHGPVADAVLVGGPVEVSATITTSDTSTDDAPAGLTWEVTLERLGTRLGAEAAAVTVLGSGFGPVDDGVIATIDPTLLPNGIYELTVVASDGFQTGGVAVRYSVAGEFKPGRFAFSVVDVAVPLGGIPIVITRTYDSLLASESGDFGPGWHMGFSGAVSDSPDEAADLPSLGALAALTAEPFTRTSRVVVTRPDGRRVGFTFAPEPAGFPLLTYLEPSFDPDPGVEDTLIPVGAGLISDYGGAFYDLVYPYNPKSYVLATREGLLYTIDEAAGLQRVEDAYGNSVDVTPEGLEHSSGVAVLFERDDAGRVARIIEPPVDAETPGAERRYDYDPVTGALVTSWDQDDARTDYAYEEPLWPLHLTGVVDDLGRAVLENFYHDDGRLLATCDASGDPLTLDGCALAVHDPEGGLVTSFDGLGQRLDTFYDAYGNVTLTRTWIDDADWYESATVFDGDGRPLEVSDHSGGQAIYSWDAAGRRSTVTDAAGRTLVYSYATECAGPTAVTDELGGVTRFEYDAACEPTVVKDAIGRSVSLTYDDLGALTEVAEPVGGSWTFGYDAFGRRDRVTDPLGASQTVTYDGAGHVLTRTHRMGQTATYSYDVAGRMLSETWDSDPPLVTSYAYDGVGRLTSAEAPDVTTTVTYAATGLVATVTQAVQGGPAATLTYTYDAKGQPVRVEDSAGGVTEYDFDVLRQVSAVRQTSSSGVERRVDVFDDPRTGELRLERFADLAGTLGVVDSTYTHGCLGCVSELSAVAHVRADDQTDGGTVLDAMTLTRDAVGNVASVVDGDGTHSYGYDGLGQLLVVDHPEGAGLPAELYVYDAAGNRTESHLSAGHSYSYESLGAGVGGGHRLLQDDRFDYAYDAAGNLTSATDRATSESLDVAWNVWGRPASLRRRASDGTVIQEATLLYDAWGRRVRTTVDGVARTAVFDGHNAVLELDDAGAVAVRRLYLRAVDSLIAEEQDGATRWHLADQVGTTRLIVNDAAETLAQFSLDAFGRVLGASPAEGVAGGARFQGRPSLLGVYDFRGRLYDAEQGRFLSEDALFPFRYVFGGNNPLLWTDRRGLSDAVEDGLARIAARLRPLQLPPPLLGGIP